MPSTNLQRRMSSQDAAFLYFESERAPLHVGSVAVMEGSLPFDVLLEATASKMHLIPRYRQRLVVPPFYVGHPSWEDDPGFSLERHIFQVQLPPPGTREQLEQLTSELFEPPMKRDRPLWDIHVIYGLEDGNTAMLSRVHHCLIDGVSGMELTLILLDLVPDPAPVAPPDEAWAPRSLPGPVQAWTNAVLDQWERNLQAFADLRLGALEPRAQLRRATDLARAVGTATPAMLRRPRPMRWNRRISSKRRVAWAEMLFQEVRAIRSALGGTVNDVVLAIIGGALGRYLRAHGERTDGVAVRVMIPTNVRSEEEAGALGNRVSMMLADVPVGIEDAVARLEAVRSETSRVKAQDQSGAFESFLQMAENVPPAIQRLAGFAGVPGGTFNLVCTNVPGPMIPLYSVGHRMISFWGMLPLAADLGIGVAIGSYDKSLYVSIMSEPSIVEDVSLIRDFIDEEFQALRRAAHVDSAEPVEVHVVRPKRRPPSANGARPRAARTKAPAASTSV